MPNHLILGGGGDKVNLLERVLSGAITVSDEDSLFLRANLYGRIPSMPFRFGSTGADRTITIDGNLITNGGMETANGGNVATWIEANTGTGDVTRTTTGGEFSVGSAGMKLVSGTGTATAYQDIRCRAGERLTIAAALKGTGANAASVRIQNLGTTKYLTSGAAWSGSASNVLSNTSSSFVASSVSFVVESYATCRSDLVTLRVSVQSLTSSSTVFADEVYMWPSVDFCSIHGALNLDPSISVEFRSDTSAFAGAGTLQATMTAALPSFYSALSSLQDIRYWRVKFTGTNSTASGAIYIGQLVMGQKLAVGAGPGFPIAMRYVEDQVRDDASTRVYSSDGFDRRRAEISYQYRTAAELSEAIGIMRRARMGKHPLVVVVRDDEPDVLFCRTDNERGFNRIFEAANDEDKVTLTELPFPVFMPT